MRNKKSDVTQQNNSKLSLQVMNDLTVQVLPNQLYDFLMTSREVEIGYGVTTHSLRMTRSRNDDEFIEGKHYVLGKGVTDCYPFVQIQPHQVFWTKAGIIRLGFFIKSERAKLFRDWAEELVLNKSVQTTMFEEPKALPKRRNHNRLSKDRMIDILQDVCQIENSELRLSLLTKLKGGQDA